MLPLRSIILRLSGSDVHLEVCEVGIGMARSFGLPIRGQVILASETAILSRLPEGFLPAAARGGAVRRADLLTSADLAAGRQIKLELEQRAQIAQIDMEVTLFEALERDGDLPEGALVIRPLDLSHPDLRPQVREALGHLPGSGGVLLVPERHPARSGALLCLMDGTNAHLEATARRIADALGCDLHTVPPAAAPEAWTDLPPGPFRLVLCDADQADRLPLTGPHVPLRRNRASLLLLAPVTPQTEPTA